MLALLSAVALGAFDLNDPTVVVDLSGPWLFHSGDSPTFSQALLDDDDWQERQLPAERLPWAARFSGHAWYRLHLHVGASAAEGDFLLTIGRLEGAAELYVNGGLVATEGRLGARPVSGASALPLSAAVPAGVLHTGDNVIALRVYDPAYGNGVVAGPLLIGPVATLAPVVRRLTALTLGAELALGVLALVVTVALALAFGPSGEHRSELGWTMAGGVALGLWHGFGLSAIESLMPSLSLALRAPNVVGALGVLFIARGLATRFGEEANLAVQGGSVAILAVAAAILLMPEAWAFFAARPLLFVTALATTLYLAHLSLQAARRDEGGALVLFAGLVIVACALLADALWPISLRPQIGSVAGVGLLVVSGWISARDQSRQYASAVAGIARLRRRLDDREHGGILDTLEAARMQPQVWLQAAVREAAARLKVRRCSLILGQTGGTLIVRAAVGLPTHLENTPISTDASVAGYVFKHGVALNQRDWPEELRSLRRSRSYLTDAFVSYPVRSKERILGVLSVSDKEDSTDFSPDEELVIAQVADALAELLDKNLV